MNELQDNNLELTKTKFILYDRSEFLWRTHKPFCILLVKEMIFMFVFRDLHGHIECVTFYCMYFGNKKE